jgi:hypothetical protein
MNLRPLCLIAALGFSCGSVLALGETDNKAASVLVEAEYKAAAASCDKISGIAKDVCMADAKGKRSVARAELDATMKDSPRARATVAEEKADASYNVAKEKCDDLAGNAKDVCVADAKAQHEKAKAMAKEQQKVSAARADAHADARDAEYKAAKERCDSYAGDAKDKCVADLKARYNK